MSYHAVTTRLFGKMPTHGDFVSRGIDPGLRNQMDNWLSSEMETARARYADTFDARYDAAPSVRFALESDDGQWEGGALCPSVDSAGRRFPLIVWKPAADRTTAVVQAGQCEQAVYEAFGQAMTADDLAAYDNGPEDGEEVDMQETGWWIEAENERVSLCGPDVRPALLLSRLLEVAA